MEDEEREGKRCSKFSASCTHSVFTLNIPLQSIGAEKFNASSILRGVRGINVPVA